MRVLCINIRDRYNELHLLDFLAILRLSPIITEKVNL